MKRSLTEKLSPYLNARNEYIPVVTYEGLSANTILGDHAEVWQIDKLQDHFNGLLPPHLLYLLLVFNGAIFYNYKGLGGIQFFNSEECIKENEFQKGNYKEDWDDRVVLVCRCLGDGDYIGLRIIDNHRYQILDCYHEVNPADWKVIGESIEVFLEKLLDEKGRKYWL